MECPRCHSQNEENHKFCRQCGAKLIKICPKCGCESLPSDNFCGECGHNFSEPGEVSPGKPSSEEQLDLIKKYLPKDLSAKILAQRDKMEGERKQVTVMFCDMEGYTSLAELLGPEASYAVMNRVYEILIRSVHDFEGTVNEMTGDGIMALFGAPVALEDAPQRAVRSASAIHREIAGFSDRIHQDNPDVSSVKMRIGLHTGPVVVGALGNDLRVEFKAVGDTVNLTSRIQDLADPGTTCVSEDTFKLTEGMFRFEALGERTVKGRKKPVRIYRVIAPSTRRTRFDISAERGLTPFIGRERELDLLLDGFERARQGRGQAFSIIAEAGVGKSRLLYEFRKAVSNKDMTFLEGKCLSYSRGVAYHPVIDILKAYFEIQGTDTDSDIRDKVRKGLHLLGTDETRILPFILELLSVHDSGIDQIPLSPEARKAEILGVLKRIVLKGSEARPLIVAVEDLHWIDKSSEEILKDVLVGISGATVMLIVTYRPDFVHTWGGKSYHCQVNLNRLSNRESLIMVSHLLGTREHDRHIEDFILERTEGIPFFIEEFMKSLRDLKMITRKNNRYIAVKDLRDISLPSTIQEVIMARIDSLPEGARKTLQLGSVIGREFSFRVIKETTRIPEEELLSQLSTLKELELIYERGIYPESTFIFRHALTQDAVYQSLLKNTRLKYHETIATVLENRLPETANSNPELMGRHFTEAGLFDRAIPYWREAGERALRRSAHLVAVDHFNRGLELLKNLPEIPERLEQELALQIALYAPLAGAKGYSAPEVAAAYNRARKLCEKVQNRSQLFLVIYGLWGHNLVRSELQTCGKLATQSLELARDIEDPALLMEACRMTEETALYTGEFERAKDYLDKSFNHYDPEKHHTHAETYGQDPGMALMTHGSWILWHLGFPDRARKSANNGLKHARERRHPFSLVFALYVGSVVFYLCREVQTVRERVEEAIELADEYKLPMWKTWATPLRGWVLVKQGQTEKGIELIRGGLAESRSAGLEVHRSYHLSLLAEACGDAGRIEEGLKALDEAIGMADEKEQRFYEAELHRIRGEFLMRGGEVTAAETAFQKALETARRQGALSLELRATMSLSRFWKKRGGKDEARRILAAIYSRFTEGFDTADLSEAHGLLKELG